MAYQSKYTGLQIDDILDSVEWKEGKIEDLEQIRAGAQKGATALQSYTEKYTGTVTGIKINGETKSGSGVIDLGTISTDISGKVDKVAGKQLSTEDFTTALKTKLEGLSNYDDTELSNAVETLRGDFDEIVSGDTTTAIKTFNEVIAFLDGLTDTQDLESIIASIEQQIAGKMDTLISGTNIKTINGESILGSGDITIEGGESSQPMVSTTWAELKEMRDSASLVAGTWYRITDYVTTTSQSGTRSLEHPFDVIVLATGADTLSEEARAARHEGDVSVSVSLMGMSFFYKGVLTVDGVEWFEFESLEFGSLVTSSATPAIGDIVYPYVDGMVATEEAYPIESVSESENEYFLNNNANLDAWKIWYCLDNDKVRFPWAVAKTKKSIVVQMDEATLLTAEYNGTYEYEGVMYYRWDVFYSGMNVLFLTVSDNPKVGDTTSVYGIIEMDIFLPYPIPIVSVNEPSENEGLGVIYRMIDEQNNDIPYDFKNIQFVRKVTLGKLDLENGADEFVFTFNSFNENTGNNSDYSFNALLCRYNNIKSSSTGLNNIVFFNESTSLVGCYSNTFGYNCYSNTFGYNCYSITFGNDCYSNTFGNYCYSNTFGDNCYSHTFGDNCYSNTFGNDCYSNTFGETAETLVSYVINYTLANGVNYQFIPVEGNRNYETYVAYDSNGELKIYCEADTTGNTLTIDTEISSSSTNAVQNKVIKSYIDSNCNIPVETTTLSTKSLTANIYYKWTNTPTSITITLTTPTNANILNNYMFEFTASSSGCTLSVPSSIKWLNETPPVIEPGKTYQISIINNLATVAKFG